LFLCVTKKTIKVVVLELGNLSKIAEISSSLEGMQEVVSRMIDAMYLNDEEITLFCNKEGKHRRA